MSTMCLLLSLLICAPPAPSAVSNLGASGMPEAPPSQSAGQQQGALRVFIDCQNFYCDFDHFRREINFIDYVRDRQDAQVHALVTTQATGGGGTEFTIELIGREEFQGADNRLHYNSNATDTADEIRSGLTQTLKLALLRYVAELPVATEIQVTYASDSEETAPAATTPEEDPWSYWVFRTSVNGRVNGQQSVRSTSLSGSVSANRITEAWKIQLGANGRYSESQFEFSDGSSFTSITRSYAFDALVVKSLSEHWSAGFRGSLDSSTFVNLDLGARLAPALEYNFFPYSESTRRQFTVRYEIGPTWNDYREETVFDKLSEVLFSESLAASLSAKQPWGTVSASLVGSHLFHDLNRYRVSLFTALNLRVVKGLSLNVFGFAAFIRDQLFLPKRGASPEEVLVQRQQLETSYQYFVSLGISYTFGSIYSNVVNPRFSNSDGVFFF